MYYRCERPTFGTTERNAVPCADDRSARYLWLLVLLTSRPASDEARSRSARLVEGLDGVAGSDLPVAEHISAQTASVDESPQRTLRGELFEV